MFVGYARVSSIGQSLNVQLKTLEAAGCEKIFVEKRSGLSRRDRTALADALAYVREGDTFMVTSLDRLARSAGDLHVVVKELTEKGVAFQCIEQPGTDTGTSTGKLLLGMLASIAEFEPDIRRERQPEGIERPRPQRFTRAAKPSVDGAAVRELRERGFGGTETARRLGFGRASVYRALKQ